MIIDTLHVSYHGREFELEICEGQEGPGSYLFRVVEIEDYGKRHTLIPRNAHFDSPISAYGAAMMELISRIGEGYAF